MNTYKKTQNNTKPSLLNRFNVYLTNRPNTEIQTPSLEQQQSIPHPETTKFTSKINSPKYSPHLSRAQLTTSNKDTRDRYAKHIKFLQKNLQEKERILQEKDQLIQELEMLNFESRCKVEKLCLSNRKLAEVIKKSDERIKQLKGKTQSEELLIEIGKLQNELEMQNKVDDSYNNGTIPEEYQNSEIEEKAINKNQIKKTNEESATTIKKQFSHSDKSSITLANLFTKEEKSIQVQLVDKSRIQQLEREIQHLMNKLEQTRQQWQRMLQEKDEKVQEELLKLGEERKQMMEEVSLLKEENEQLKELMKQLQEKSKQSIESLQKICKKMQKPIEQLVQINQMGFSQVQQARGGGLNQRILILEQQILKNEKIFKQYSIQQQEKLGEIQQDYHSKLQALSSKISQIETTPSIQ